MRICRKKGTTPLRYKTRSWWTNDIWMDQLTEKGLNVSVTVTGAKYYKDDSLN